MNLNSLNYLTKKKKSPTEIEFDETGPIIWQTRYVFLMRDVPIFNVWHVLNKVTSSESNLYKIKRKMLSYACQC
jgi:hypothetical protein